MERFNTVIFQWHIYLLVGTKRARPYFRSLSKRNSHIIFFLSSSSSCLPRGITTGVSFPPSTVNIIVIIIIVVVILILFTLSKVLIGEAEASFVMKRCHSYFNFILQNQQKSVPTAAEREGAREREVGYSTRVKRKIGSSVSSHRKLH